MYAVSPWRLISIWHGCFANLHRTQKSPNHHQCVHEGALMRRFLARIQQPTISNFLYILACMGTFCPVSTQRAFFESLVNIPLYMYLCMYITSCPKFSCSSPECSIYSRLASCAQPCSRHAFINIQKPSCTVGQAPTMNACIGECVTPTMSACIGTHEAWGMEKPASC
jgi:hypothetical protein